MPFTLCYLGGERQNQNSHSGSLVSVSDNNHFAILPLYQDNQYFKKFILLYYLSVRISLRNFFVSKI